MPGVFIILIGVAALLFNLDVINDRTLWIAISVIVILIGLGKLCRGCCKCCENRCQRRPDLPSGGNRWLNFDVSPAW